MLTNRKPGYPTEVARLYGNQAYLLRNRRGTTVVIDALGASIRGVEVADRWGRFSNIALCPEEPGDSYAGATLAPCAGRIRKGRLLIDGRAAQLSLNDGPNHLHGGGSLSFARWRGEARSTAEGEACALSITARDGLDGYPGERRFEVIYALTEDDQLIIRMRASTDRATWVNMSNHVYWNLSGDFSGTVDEHRLRVGADHVYLNDAAHLPIGRRPVAGTPFDFREERPIWGGGGGEDDEQLAAARGYNHGFALNGAPAATLTDPVSGRRLRLYTDYPALVLYSGGFLHEGIALSGGGRARQRCALALEPQTLPGSEAALLRPGEVRERTIRYAFDVDPPRER